MYPSEITVWIASFESRHFNFDGYGRTEEEAIGSLKRVLKNHTRQYQLGNTDWYCVEDFSLLRVRTGVGYRDGAEIK